jgi:hypothetical protein
VIAVPGCCEHFPLVRCRSSHQAVGCSVFNNTQTVVSLWTLRPPPPTRRTDDPCRWNLTPVDRYSFILQPILMVDHSEAASFSQLTMYPPHKAGVVLLLLLLCNIDGLDRRQASKPCTDIKRITVWKNKDSPAQQVRRYISSKDVMRGRAALTSEAFSKLGSALLREDPEGACGC